MVRSSRASALLVLAAGVLAAACGGDEPQPFRLHIASPAAGTTEVPFAVAPVRGVATSVETLTLRVAAGDETYAFTARPGTTMAFRVGAEPAPAPVTLVGLEAPAPGPDEVVRAFGQRVAEAAPEAAVRDPVGEAACLVDLPIDREDLWPAVVGAGSPPADLRFLVEVLPRERYLRWREDGRSPPRLESPAAPWPGTAEAFETFKEAEVARWSQAQAAGQPYAPSRPDLLVLPRAGKEAAGVHDFAVLEWPQDPAHRFDGRMLEHALTSRDPNTGKPVVLYDVREPYREAFEAWTGANLGLPMAIVLDWEVRSAPTIQSALRDKVQITLGSGRWSELEAEAQALTRTLGGAVEGPSAALVAVCAWRPGGALEVLLPLTERVDTTLVVEASGAAEGHQARVERTFRRVSGIEADAADAVDARLAEIVLGALEVEAAAVLLRADPAGAVAQLARIARGDVSDVRRRAAARLLGLLGSDSQLAVRVLVDLVDDDDSGLAAEAARALEQPAKHDDAAFEALLRGVASTDGRLRLAARSSLGGVRSERREALLARIDDPDLAVREAVLMALGSFGVDGEGAWEDRLLPAYVSRLRDENAGMRRTALMMLHELVAMRAKGVKEHVDEIAACLVDDDLQVRSAAAACLGGLRQRDPAGPRALPRGRGFGSARRGRDGAARPRRAVGGDSGAHRHREGRRGLGGPAHGGDDARHEAGRRLARPFL